MFLPIALMVKLVTIAMLKTTVAAVVWVRLIYAGAPAPKLIVRTPVPDELNIPVFRVAPSPNVNVPAVNVYVPVAVKPTLVLNVTVPAVWVNKGVVEPIDAEPSTVSDPEFCTKLTLA